MKLKKLERWCEAVRERAENMLTSSLNTPAGSACGLRHQVHQTGMDLEID
jgi:hypothetical protein